jgi:hypothetical protein
MKRHLFGIVIVGVALGNIGINSEQYNKEHPLVYTAEAQVIEPRVILIGTTTPEKTIEEKIKEAFPEDEITALKIAQCESGLNPNAHNNRNKNGSTDGGLYQINSVHDKRLNELGLDKYDIEDNIAFARRLYEENGWRPWVCSKKI